MEEIKTKNVYEKLQQARVELQNKNNKKSGKNKFANFSYYELADFLPSINEIFNNIGLISLFNMTRDTAILEIINIENVQDKIEFMCPVESAEIKGSTPIQCLGGQMTYLRRYLYLNALEIVENDTLDAKVGDKTLTTKEEKDNEDKLALLNKLNILIASTNADLDKIKEYYEVDSTQDMSIKQLNEVIATLEKRVQ